MQGKVKFYNKKKGYGFITADDGTEYFVHVTGIKDNIVLETDMDVVFDVEQSDRGQKAIDVQAGS